MAMAAVLAAPQLLIMANSALGLFTELARAYSSHPEAEADQKAALDALLPQAEATAAAVQAYRPIPKVEPLPPLEGVDR